MKAKPKTPASVPDMFILIGVGELKCIIEVHFRKLYIVQTFRKILLVIERLFLININ